MHRMTFEQALINGEFSTCKAYSAIEQFNSLVFSGDTVNAMANEVKEPVYDHNFVEVIEITSENMKKQYMDQLIKGRAPSITVRTLDDFLNIVKKADPDRNVESAILLQIDGNTFVLADFDFEVVAFKKLSKTLGCMVVYSPKRNIIVKIEE